MKCTGMCKQGRECTCMPLDFADRDPEDDVGLTVTEMIGVALFAAALLAAGFVIGRVTV